MDATDFAATKPTFALSTNALAGSFLPENRALQIAGSIGFAIAGSLLLALSAKIKVPFYPVPMTMQTFALMALVAAFGLRLGVATVALYLVEGAFGLPVFTGTPEKGLGLAYMAGPTGGYLLGYLVAAVVVGLAIERGYGRSPFALFATMLVGSAAIFGLGILWMGILFGWDKPLLAWGLYPFIVGDLTKIALAAALIPALTALISKFRKAD